MDDTEPNPLDIALERLTKLIAAGSSPATVTGQIGSMIASWADEADMNPAVAQARIAHLWDSVSKDAADLQERLADAEGGNVQAEAQARRVLAAMTAAVDTLAAMHGAM